MTISEFPAWVPWTAWIACVGCGVVASVQVVKLSLYKRSTGRWHHVWRRQRTAMDKAMLLLPWKAGIGTLLGVLVFREAGLLESPVLSGALGLGAGSISAAIYDSLLTLPAALVDGVKARIGGGVQPESEFDQTAEVPAVDEEGA